VGNWNPENKNKNKNKKKNKRQKQSRACVTIERKSWFLTWKRILRATTEKDIE